MERLLSERIPNTYNRVLRDDAIFAPLATRHYNYIRQYY